MIRATPSPRCRRCGRTMPASATGSRSRSWPSRPGLGSASSPRRTPGGAGEGGVRPGSRRRARGRHAARRRGLRAERRRVRRSGRPLGALRAHVVGRARHGARAAAPCGRRSVARKDRAAARRDEAAGAVAPRDGDGRKDARGPRRADHLRTQGRPVDVRARPRSGAVAPRARGRGRGSDQRRRRDLRAGGPAGRGGGLREDRPAARGGFEPGRGARSPRRAHERARDHRDDARRCRDRDPAPRANRGPRGPRAVRRGAEGFERDAAQAQPGSERTDHRARPSDPRQPAGGAGERGAVARARHLALVGRARHPSGLDDRPRLHAGRAHRGPGGTRRCIRIGCERTSTSAAGSRTRRTCCSRSSIRGCRETTPTRSSSRRAAKAWDEGGSFRAFVEDDAQVRRSDRRPARRAVRPDARPSQPRRGVRPPREGCPPDGRDRREAPRPGQGPRHLRRRRGPAAPRRHRPDQRVRRRLARTRSRTKDASSPVSRCSGSNAPGT